MREPAAHPASDAAFVTELTNHQGDLWAFLCSLMPGHPDVADVLQNTNMVLWRKQSQFTPGTNFRAWAFRIARFEMLHHLRTCRRDDWIPFDEQLADTVAKECPEALGASHERLAALESCIEKLREKDRQLLEHRYRRGSSLDEYAGRSGRSVSALSVTLFRLRSALRKCVEQNLPQEGGAQ